jgi:hypothetical protein
MLFFATYLEPTTRELGPAAAPLMQGLMRRGYFTVMPVIAAIAILSGATMLWIDSAGLSPGWMGSRAGMAYSTGALSAIIALGIGLGVMRPATLRMAALGASAAAVPEGPARQAHMARMPALRARITGAVRWTAALLAVALVSMAVARYLG